MKIAQSVHFEQRCVECSRTYEIQEHVTRCKCGGLVSFEYDLDSSRTWQPRKRKGLVRYWPYLPVIDPSHLIQPRGSSRFPTRFYKSRRLAKFLGLENLWIKDETGNPTETFKDRDALVTISRFQEINLTEFILCSTGNTAKAFAHAMNLARFPMTAHMFIPESAIFDTLPRTKMTANMVAVEGDYRACIERASEYSLRTGIPLEGGFANPCRREGSKTIAYEVAESGVRPDWYVQGVTSGCGVYAFYKGYTELREMGLIDSIPRLLCVQPEACAPMVKAFKKGREKIAPEDVVTHPDTFATTLTNTNPSLSYPYVRQVVLDSKGTFEEVREAEIARAFFLLFKLEGLVVDPAAAVALAGVIKAISNGVVQKHEIVVLNVSGAIRKELPTRNTSKQTQFSEPPTGLTT